MATRTVRLDEESERQLEDIRRARGISVSEALKRGLRALHAQDARKASPLPFEIYAELDLGPGGYAIAPASSSRRGVRTAIKRKLRR